jgi:hypothetical protein
MLIHIDDHRGQIPWRVEDGEPYWEDVDVLDQCKGNLEE